jgi:hypothetical protein
LAKIARTEAIGTIHLGVISGDQHGVRTDLHFVLKEDPSLRLQPAARSKKDIVANFHAIREIDIHVTRYLQVLPATFERRPQQKPAHP